MRVCVFVCVTFGCQRRLTAGVQGGSPERLPLGRCNAAHFSVPNAHCVTGEFSLETFYTQFAAISFLSSFASLHCTSMC